MAWESVEREGIYLLATCKEANSSLCPRKIIGRWEGFMS